MNKAQKKLIIIIVNSILLGLGILGIIIPNIINSNWYSLFTILVFCLSIIFPLMCNALNVSGNYTQGDILFMDDDGENMEKSKALSWTLTGIMITIGYSIPFLLWRNKHMPILNMSLAMGGGSVILISIGIFVATVFKLSDS
jgi:hypothetical protein